MMSTNSEICYKTERIIVTVTQNGKTAQHTTKLHMLNMFKSLASAVDYLEEACFSSLNYKS